MTKLVYARVSTKNQDLQLQLDAFKKEGVERIFQEKTSGAMVDREQLAKMLDYAREGDLIIVWKLDRLARSLAYLIKIVNDLDKRRIGLKVLTGAPIDTTTPRGKLTFAIFGALAEFERDGARQRRPRGCQGAGPRRWSPGIVGRTRR